MTLKVKRFVGSRLRLTLAVGTKRVTTFTDLPSRNTWMRLTTGLRGGRTKRIVTTLRLTHFFALGSLTAWSGFGMTSAGFGTTGLGVGVGVGVGTGAGGSGGSGGGG